MGIVVLTTPVCMYVLYNNMKQRIEQIEVVRLQQVNDMTASLLSQGVPPEAFASNKMITVERYDNQVPQPSLKVNKGLDYNEQLNKNQFVIEVTDHRNIKGINYKITAHNNTLTTEDLIGTMLDVQLWKWIFIIGALFVTAGLVSKLLFAPFRKSMESIREFNVKQKHKIELVPTSTKEFKELNCFLEKMTEKAREDYALMKQFSENASHELQTPLAVLRSKLELLSETAITENQAFYMEDMQNAIDKLSRIHRSLTLLTKIELQAFEASSEFNINQHIADLLEMYADTFEMKRITVSTDIQKDISVTMHPALAEMLISNLMNNAIRHNTEGGYIKLAVRAGQFSISNSGFPLECPVEELFNRFYKGSKSVNGTGLGLAIVKQICNVNGFDIDYYYADEVHTVTVNFNGRAKAAEKKEFAEMV